MYITRKECCTTPDSQRQKSWESVQNQTCISFNQGPRSASEFPGLSVLSCTCPVSGTKTHELSSLHPSPSHLLLWFLQDGTWLWMVKTTRSQGTTKTALVVSRYSHLHVYLVIRKVTKHNYMLQKPFSITLPSALETTPSGHRHSKLFGKFLLCSYYPSMNHVRQLDSNYCCSGQQWFCKTTQHLVPF